MLGVSKSHHFESSVQAKHSNLTSMSSHGLQVRTRSTVSHPPSIRILMNKLEIACLRGAPNIVFTFGGFAQFTEWVTAFFCYICRCVSSPCSLRLANVLCIHLSELASIIRKASSADVRTLHSTCWVKNLRSHTGSYISLSCSLPSRTIYSFTCQRLHFLR